MNEQIDFILKNTKKKTNDSRKKNKNVNVIHTNYFNQKNKREKKLDPHYTET